MPTNRRRAAIAALAFWIGTLGSPSGSLAAPVDPTPPAPADREKLARYARDTWHSLDAMVGPGGLPADKLARGDDGAWRPTAKTTPTDIAAYLWSILAAEDLGIIEPAEARRRLDRTLSAVARIERVHGFFLDKLDPRTGTPLKVSPDDGKPIRPILSAVDNGWLAAALIMVRNTRPPLRERADTLLKPMDFGFFYEPYDPADPEKHPGQLHGTYQVDEHAFGALHALINTEPRIASYVGIARGQIPPEHYYRIGRTLPLGRAPQAQPPRGEARTYRGTDVFEGHYTYRGRQIVPSWGGSMFEALMVPLFVPEDRWAPQSWGINHPLYVRAQIEHGLREARYGYWGFSPCSKPEGGYRDYGLAALGVSPKGYPSNNDDTRYDPNHPAPPEAYTNGVVTPHASFLALQFAPREALANLEAIAVKFPVYGPYGFHDSVNVSSGRVSDGVLALDQGMIMAAIANALVDGAIQRAFSEGEIEAAIRPLIAPEGFTASPPRAGVGP